MMGDALIGSFLSGGIDSSIVVALASEIDPSIKTFTAGFEVDGCSCCRSICRPTIFYFPRGWHVEVVLSGEGSDELYDWAVNIVKVSK